MLNLAPGLVRVYAFLINALDPALMIVIVVVVRAVLLAVAPAVVHLALMVAHLLVLDHAHHLVVGEDLDVLPHVIVRRAHRDVRVHVKRRVLEDVAAHVLLAVA